MKRNFPLSCRLTRDTRRRAFTLVELMVVIAIAAVVTGLTLGGYRSMADGNQRVSCQTNLTQVYAALQLYNKDYNGLYPYYDPATTLNGTTGLGLWALYGYRTNTSPDKIALLNETLAGSDHNKPFGTYVRNRKMLHCPSDVDHESFFDVSDATNNTIDMSFLSYQVNDGTEQTYQPWRGVTDNTQWNAKRQLMRAQTAPLRLQGRPQSDAVITWCPWHRGKRDMDNVLFASGAVRPVPKVQTNPNYPVPTPQPTEPAELQGWNRKPPF